MSPQASSQRKGVRIKVANHVVEITTAHVADVLAILMPAASFRGRLGVSFVTGEQLSIFGRAYAL